MKNARSKARLYVTAPLSTGAAVELTTGQGHYLVHVMRLGPGDSVAVFNGRDGEWRAALETAGKKSAALLRVEEKTRNQESGPDAWLAFAPVKKTRTDFIVEKATELGAARLLPVFTELTETKRVNAERLRSVAIEAAEQCRRLDVPTIEGAQTLESLCRSWPAARRLLVLDEGGHETGRAEPILAALARLKQEHDRPALGFLAGPEGGFATGELDGLRELPFASPVSLGPRILRAETAVVAALACFQAITEVP